MDGFQLFRKLGFGAKFDLKRFQNDASKLKIINPKSEVIAVTGKDVHDTGRQHRRQEEVKREQDNIKSRSKRKTDRDKDAPSAKKLKVQEALPSSSDEDKDTSFEEGDDCSDDGDDGSNDGDDSSDDGDDRGSDRESADDGVEMETKQTHGDSDSEIELQLLGNIRSSGKTKPTRRKKKKKDLNKTDSQQKKLNTMRKKQKIHVEGTDVPPPLTSFDDLRTQYNLHNTLMANIGSVGYEEPTPIQMQAVPVMLQRRDLMACAPTGSGKTAAFIIPILHHLKEPRNMGFRAVALAPTRELAKQTYREFQRLSEGLGFRTFYIEKASTAVKKFGPKSKRKFDILVTTPNRLVYILQKHPDIINLNSVEWLVVDESDKLFEEGKRGFRDQLGVIYKACNSTHVRRAMFSATFACDVEDWCKLNLDNVVQVYVGLRNSATETVQQELVFVGSESGKLLAVRQLIQKGIQPPVLVFVQSKDRAKELFHELIYDGVNVDVIHSDRTQLERDNVVKCFRLGKIWVLICTELMGRGIDFKGVNLVINYDFPYSAISYIHRIGRTGRAGRPGRAITYFTQDDSVYLRGIANIMKQAGCPVPDYMLKLARPSKKRRKKLAHSAPDRTSISTKSQYDVEQEQKLKTEKMKSLYKKKPRPSKKINSEQRQENGQKSNMSTSQHMNKSEKSNAVKSSKHKAKKNKKKSKIQQTQKSAETN